MATFAVCMSGQEGNKTVWSLVASIDLNGTFATLFDRHNNERYDFASAHVAVSPSGPWQDVGKHETLDVLRVLNMRHILFKVSSKEAVEAENTQKQSTDGLQLLMTQARKRGLPKRKAEGNAKDKLYNRIIDNLGQKGLDLPNSVCDSDGSYFVRVCI